MDSACSKAARDGNTADLSSGGVPCRRKWIDLTKYETCKQIWSGTFSEVHLVRSHKEDTADDVYVMKRIDHMRHEAWARRSQSRQTVWCELAFLSEVGCQHRPYVLESGTEGSITYIVMEYCAGGDACHFVLKHGALGCAELGHIGVRVANGLQYMHHLNIAHRGLGRGAQF